MSCPSMPTNPTNATNFDKGSVYWFDMTGSSDPAIASQKARPYIIISRHNPKSNRVIVSPVSGIEHYLEKDGSGKLKYPYHAKLLKSSNSFLDKDSVVLLDQVFTVGKDEFVNEWYMGTTKDISDIDEAMFYNFDLWETIQDCMTNAMVMVQQERMKAYSRK